MKKMFTLIAAVIMVATVFAQQNNGNGYGNSSNKDVAFNDRGYNNNNDRRNYKWDNAYKSNLRERDMKIARINEAYDRKIDAVRHRLFMNRSKKEAMIYSLEDQRRDEIRKVYMKYRITDSRFDDGRNRH